MLIIKQKVNLTISEYLSRVVSTAVKPTLITIVAVFAIIYFFNFEYRFIITIFVSTLVLAVSIYFTALEKDEKLDDNGHSKTTNEQVL